MTNPRQKRVKRTYYNILLPIMRRVKEKKLEPEAAITLYGKSKFHIKHPLKRQFGKLESYENPILLEIMESLQKKPDMTPEEAVEIYNDAKLAFGDPKEHHHHKNDDNNEYYHLMNPKISSAIITDRDTTTGKAILLEKPLLHIPSRLAPFHKVVKAFRDNFGYKKITIPYLIEKLNAAYENGDIKKVESYLRQLGLDEKRTRLTIKNLVSLNAKEKSAQTTTTPSLIKQAPK